MYFRANTGSGLGKRRPWNHQRLRQDARRIGVIVGVAVTAGLLFPYPVTKLVVGAALASVYVIWLNKDMGLAISLAAFSIPVQDLTPQWLLLLFPGSNIATAVLLLLAVFCFQHRGTSATSAREEFPLKVPLVAFLLVCVVSIVQSWLFAGGTLTHLLPLFKNHFSTLLFMVIAFSTLKRPEQRVLVFATIICIDALVALQSVMDYGGGVRERSKGLIGGQPNLYGGFLAMQLPFFLAACLSPHFSSVVRGAVAAMSLLLIQALFLTGSRGAWVAAAVAIATVALMANRRAFVALLVAYAFVPLIAYGVNQTRLESLLQLAQGEQETEDDRSVQYRVEVWKNLGSLMAPPYVLGRGYASGPQAIERLGISEDENATHSSIISILVELGALGLLLYLLILGRIWRTALSLVRHGSAMAQTLGAGFVGAVPALIVCDFSGTRFHNGEVMAFFWLMAGLMFREAASPHGAVDSAQVSQVRGGHHSQPRADRFAHLGPPSLPAGSTSAEPV